MRKLIMILMIISSSVQANFEKFCDAVKHKEQGPGETSNPYEIHYAFFIDARNHLYRLGYHEHIHYHQLKHNEALCRLVIKAYLHRYARQALLKGEWYKLARIYNGGPKGNNKNATKDYAQCVVNLMDVD